MNYTDDVPEIRGSEDRMIVPRVRIQAIGMFESREGVGTDGGPGGEGLKSCEWVVQMGSGANSS